MIAVTSASFASFGRRPYGRRAAAARGSLAPAAAGSADLALRHYRTADPSRRTSSTNAEDHRCSLAAAGQGSGWSAPRTVVRASGTARPSNAATSSRPRSPRTAAKVARLMVRQLIQTIRVEIHGVCEEAAKFRAASRPHPFLCQQPERLLATTVTVAYDNAETMAPRQILLQAAHLRTRAVAASGPQRSSRTRCFLAANDRSLPRPRPRPRGTWSPVSVAVTATWPLTAGMAPVALRVFEFLL